MALILCFNSLVFVSKDGGDIILASAGQDYLIRIWRLSSRQAGIDDVIKSVKHLSIDEEIKMRENTFSFTHKGTILTTTKEIKIII